MYIRTRWHECCFLLSQVEEHNNGIIRVYGTRGISATFIQVEAYVQWHSPAMPKSGKVWYGVTPRKKKHCKFHSQMHGFMFHEVLVNI